MNGHRATKLFVNYAQLHNALCIEDFLRYIQRGLHELDHIFWGILTHTTNDTFRDDTIRDLKIMATSPPLSEEKHEEISSLLMSLRLS